ncbi:MAG TPA: DICT sensory domain-containing protein [Pyrinomonadaceae bacterium]|nr:DICT sensory domain-containing protein [Pyrinomonadaceae bacterium]
MFEQALKIAGTAGVEDLGRISNISRREFDERQTFIFRAQVPCLEYISLMIENALLLRPNRSGRVYVGFERLSRMEPVTGRYLRIADLSERMYVFGEPDWKPPRHPNMRLITLSKESRLAREWFVIASSSTMSVALIGVDEDGLDVPLLEARNFRAFKSSDPRIVAQLAQIADGLIDSSLAA